MINPNIKKQFPWFKNNNGWNYLDNGATTLKPQCVINAVSEYYSKYCTNTHNNDSNISAYVNNIVLECRKKIAKLINANTNEISFNSGATEGLNLIANSLATYLKTGDEIILTYGEHSSNILPWVKLSNEKNIKIKYAGSNNKYVNNESILSLITSKTKVISIASISNIIPNTIDIEKLCIAIHKKNKNILIVVDGTQTIPHTTINVKKLDIAYLVFSAHKMCGPTGLGVLYVNSKYENLTKPLRLGGGMNSTMDVNRYVCASAPDKYEGGTPNIAGIFGFNAALDFLNKIKISNIEKHEQELKKYIDSKIKNIPNIEYISGINKSPICAFNIKTIHAQDLASYLAHNKILVRSGVSCAKLQHNITNNKNGFVRASFYFYNTKQDVDKLINCLLKFKKGDLLKHVI